MHLQAVVVQIRLFIKKKIKMKVIVTGSTGMVGEGVLHQCLQSKDITEVLAINRKSCGIVHPKLKEILHTDFLDFSSIENQLTGYEPVFFVWVYHQ